jgi:hypothetical protein
MTPRALRRPTYFRRTLGQSDDSTRVVYAVIPDPSSLSPHAVATVGGFPRGLRPAEEAGQVVRDDWCIAQYWTCDVPRAQLARLEHISEADALALYPRLDAALALAKSFSASVGDGPQPV